MGNSWFRGWKNRWGTKDSGWGLEVNQTGRGNPIRPRRGAASSGSGRISCGPVSFGFLATASRKVNKTPRGRKAWFYFSTFGFFLLKAESTDQNQKVWNLGRHQEVEAQVSKFGAQVQTSATHQAQNLPKSELEVHVCPQIPLPGLVLWRESISIQHSVIDTRIALPSENRRASKSD